MNDYGQLSTTDTLHLERRLPGSIERVWQYLTDPELRGRWLAAGPMALQPGGAVELIFNNGRLSEAGDLPPPKYAQLNGENRLLCRVIACRPPELLEMSWGSDSQVRFELRDEGDSVLLSITHSRLAQRDTLFSVAGGWHTHVDILAALLEARAPASFWRTHTRLEAEYARRLPH